MSTNQNYGPPAVSPQIKEREYSGPNAICVENPAGTFTNGFYREVYTFDHAAGSPVTTENTAREYTVNGTVWTSTAPVGTIRAGACVPVTVPNEIDRIATTEEGCAAGTGWTRRTEQTVDNVTGAVLTTVVSYVNAAGVAQAAAPAGFAIGACRDFMSTEIEYTGITQLCREQPAGTFTNAFSRQVREANRTGTGAFTDVTTTQYSVDGITWSTTVPTGTLRPGACVAATPTAEIDVVSVMEPGCAAGVAWTRRTNTTVNNATGALVTQTISYINAAGTAQATAPAGFTLGSCVPTETDIITTTEPGCSAGVSWTRRTDRTVNNTTGAVVLTTTSYINAAGTVQVAQPVGFTLGACATSAFFSQVFAEPGCANGVPWTRRHVQTYTNGVPNVAQNFYVNSAGTIQTAIPAGFTLGDCPLVPATFTTTVTDLLAGQTQTIAAAPNLVSWSVRNRTSTTGTFRVNGGTILPFDVTEVVESGEIDEDRGQLTDSVALVAGDGILRVTVVRRV